MSESINYEDLYFNANPSQEKAFFNGIILREAFEQWKSTGKTSAESFLYYLMNMEEPENDKRKLLSDHIRWRAASEIFLMQKKVERDYTTKREFKNPFI